jgi:tetratricopeptide (TPR) repeat protein
MSQFRLAHLGLLLAALGLNLAPSLLGITANAYAADEAKTEAEIKKAKEETVRPEINKLLNEVTPLLAAKQFKEAFATIDAAGAFPDKTPYENYALNRARAAVANSAGDRAMATKALEAVIDTGHLTPKELIAFVNILAVNYYNDKNYGKAITYFIRNMKEGNTDPQIRALLIQAYYLNKDYATTIKELQAEFAAFETNGGPPPKEDYLIMMRNSAANLKDRVNYGIAIEKMVTYYPNDEIWTELLDIMEGKPNFADRLVLDGYRLKLLVTKALPEKEYLQMAELATRVALPAEAQKAIDQGFQKGVLGVGTNAATHRQLRDRTAKAAADDAKTIVKGEAAANKAKGGNGLVNLGQGYASLGQYDKAISMIKEGIERGGLKLPEDAKLHLAIAYARADDKENALATFKTVQGTDGLTDLARYWTLYLTPPAPAAAK